MNVWLTRAPLLCAFFVLCFVFPLGLCVRAFRISSGGLGDGGNDSAPGEGEEDAAEGMDPFDQGSASDADSGVFDVVAAGDNEFFLGTAEDVGLDDEEFVGGGAWTRVGIAVRCSRGVGCGYCVCRRGVVSRSTPCLVVCSSVFVFFVWLGADAAQAILDQGQAEFEEEHRFSVTSADIAAAANTSGFGFGSPAASVSSPQQASPAVPASSSQDSPTTSAPGSGARTSTATTPATTSATPSVPVSTPASASPAALAAPARMGVTHVTHSTITSHARDSTGTTNSPFDHSSSTALASAAAAAAAADAAAVTVDVVDVGASDSPMSSVPATSVSAEAMSTPTLSGTTRSMRLDNAPPSGALHVSLRVCRVCHVVCATLCVLERLLCA